MKVRVDRILIFAVAGAALGLVVGYLAFGSRVSVADLLAARDSGLLGKIQQGIDGLRGLDVIRRDIALCGAGGAVLGLLASFAPVGMRRGRRKR